MDLYFFLPFVFTIENNFLIIRIMKKKFIWIFSISCLSQVHSLHYIPAHDYAQVKNKLKEIEDQLNRSRAQQGDRMDDHQRRQEQLLITQRNGMRRILDLEGEIQRLSYASRNTNTQEAFKVLQTRIQKLEAEKANQEKVTQQIEARLQEILEKNKTELDQKLSRVNEEIHTLKNSLNRVHNPTLFQELQDRIIVLEKEKKKIHDNLSILNRRYLDHENVINRITNDLTQAQSKQGALENDLTILRTKLDQTENQERAKDIQERITILEQAKADQEQRIQEMNNKAKASVDEGIQSINRKILALEGKLEQPQSLQELQKTEKAIQDLEQQRINLDQLKQAVGDQKNKVNDDLSKLTQELSQAQSKQGALENDLTILRTKLDQTENQERAKDIQERITILEQAKADQEQRIQEMNNKAKASVDEGIQSINRKILALEGKLEQPQSLQELQKTEKAIQDLEQQRINLDQFKIAVKDGQIKIARDLSSDLAAMQAQIRNFVQKESQSSKKEEFITQEGLHEFFAQQMEKKQKNKQAKKNSKMPMHEENKPENVEKQNVLGESHPQSNDSMVSNLYPPITHMAKNDNAALLETGIKPKESIESQDAEIVFPSLDHLKTKTMEELAEKIVLNEDQHHSLREIIKEVNAYEVKKDKNGNEKKLLVKQKKAIADQLKLIDEKLALSTESLGQIHYKADLIAHLHSLLPAQNPLCSIQENREQNLQILSEQGNPNFSSEQDALEKEYPDIAAEHSPSLNQDQHHSLREIIKEVNAYEVKKDKNGNEKKLLVKQKKAIADQLKLIDEKLALSTESLGQIHYKADLIAHLHSLLPAQNPLCSIQENREQNLQILSEQGNPNFSSEQDALEQEHPDIAAEHSIAHPSAENPPLLTQEQREQLDAIIATVGAYKNSVQHLSVARKKYVGERLKALGLVMPEGDLSKDSLLQYLKGL